MLVTQSCPTLCDPMDCRPPGSSVHGILQARILEWVAMPFSNNETFLMHTIVRTKIFLEGDGSHCWIWAEAAHSLGSPGGTSGKEPTCQCRRHKKCRFDPGVWTILCRRAWQPTPVFLPGESHGQKGLAGYSPWGCKESNTTEWLTLYTVLLCLKHRRFLT